MLIYGFSSSFRMGYALPGPGRSPMGLHPAGRAVVPKERFAGTTTGWQGSSPIFLMLIVLFVSRDQNNKDGRHFRKSTHLSDRNKHFASL